MKTVDEAIAFARKGFNVFPVHNKLPILKGWPDKATTDEDTITGWYDSFAKQADGFGVCPKDVAVIIDVDIKDGKNGAESLQSLIKDYGLPRDTLIVRTKSGGLHLYYKYPELLEGQHIKSIANWKVNGVVLDGIDIRGNRGQVVGPTTRNGYTLISDKNLEDLAELPDVLVQQLPVDKVGGLKVDVQDASALVVYDEPELKGVIPDVIPEGERHQTLLSLTASWARKQPYETAKVLLKEAISRCEGDINYEDYLERLDDAYDKFEPVIEDKLQWMLDHLVFISGTNSIYRLDKPGNVAVLDMAAARNYFSNWLIWEETQLTNGNTKTTARKAFDAWLKHPDRQNVHNVGYKPIDDRFYDCDVMGEPLINTFKPNPINAEVGDVQWFTELVEFLWEDQADTILDYCAHIVQNPTEKVHWAPLLITTNEGMGKNVFYDIFSRCLGKWNTTIINAALFNKSFNTFLIQNQLVLINEVQEINKKDRQSMISKLKSYITETAQAIEGKGQNVYTTEIFCNFFIFSNKIDSIDVESSSRRFHVHINKSMPHPDQWYREIVKSADTQGIANLIEFLKTRDISGFQYTGYAPHTESKLEVVQSNMSEYELEVRQHIDLGYSIFVSDIITEESWQYYVEHILHKGKRMSVAQEKYLKKELFTRIQYVSSDGRVLSRQLFLPAINKLSDDTTLMRGPKPRKMMCYSVRNHDDYFDLKDQVPVEIIREEYEKIFIDNMEGSAVTLVS